MRLDKGKVEEFFLNQGLSTKRSRDLAEKIRQVDVFEDVPKEERSIVGQTVTREIIEVKEDKRNDFSA